MCVGVKRERKRKEGRKKGGRKGERKREIKKVFKMQYLRNKENIFPLCLMNVDYIPRASADVLLLYFLGD